MSEQKHRQWTPYKHAAPAVTDRIINLLEIGVVPWRWPWTSTGLPRNLVSKKPYQGVNLFCSQLRNTFSPFWLTMRQANELGGHVRKGEEFHRGRILED
jgi:antirestriction protein ArdC